MPYLFLLLALAAHPGDPLDAALKECKKVAAYRVTLHSRSGTSRETIRYFFKRPGFVRMEFIEPHKGAILVYDPVKKEARLRPFGFLKPMVLTLSPDSRLITSSRGHRVDASDIGTMLETVRKLRGTGRSTPRGEEAVGGRAAVLVAVEGKGTATVAGNVHRYLLWLDAKTSLPLKMISYDMSGAVVEEVLMDDLEINVTLPDTLFEP
ncbi:MAG TPA: sigma-E factor regulatory protein RseB domain-containing protein [Geobacteraceae bacterium]